MTKKIFLVRHAKAEAEAQGQNDIERELNSTGLAQSYEMGKMLAAEGINLQLIICSSSIRTRSTAETLAKLTGYDNDKIIYSEAAYNASARTLMDIINNLDNSYETIMLIGHNPGITYIAEYFTQDFSGEIPTCGIVNIEFENVPWVEISSGMGKLIWFKYPQ